MKVVVQRSLAASVKINEQIVGEIDKGFVLLVGVTETDSEVDVDYLVGKISKMRVFEDDAGKMNLSIEQIGGKILSISQFTLYADTKKGNRPSFIKAAGAEQATALYDSLNNKLRKSGLIVETGEFGADMAVSLVNDGPVTIILDSQNK